MEKRFLNLKKLIEELGLMMFPILKGLGIQWLRAEGLRLAFRVRDLGLGFRVRCSSFKGFRLVPLGLYPWVLGSFCRTTLAHIRARLGLYWGKTFKGTILGVQPRNP